MNLTDLKQEIIKNVTEGYKVKTNFSCEEFLVSIGNIVIMAKPICSEKEVKYEFRLDTQFIPSNEITYEEIVMIKNVIDILEENRKLAISRLKKWNVEEYIENRRRKKERSEQMLEALRRAFTNNIKSLE